MNYQNICIDKYWGDSDTNIEFCEYKYYNNRYISEYYNTISNIFYIFFPLLLNNCDKILLGLSVCIGLSSGVFHMTSRYYGEFLDEIFMVIMVTTYNWKLFSILGFIWNGEVMNIIIYLYFIYFITNIYAFFNACIVLGIIFIYFQLYIFYPHGNQRIKNNIQYSLYSIISGTILWILEQSLGCKYYNFIVICHPLWHFFSALLIYYLLKTYSLIIGYSNRTPIVIE